MFELFIAISLRIIIYLLHTEVIFEYFFVITLETLLNVVDVFAY